MTPLHEALIKTVFYFDQCDFAPTLLELEKWMIETNNLPSVSLHEMMTTIERSDILTLHNGMVVRTGKKHLIQQRMDAYGYSEQKWKRVRPFLRLLSIMPGVEGIWLCNGMGWGNVKKTSDIDLCIVTTSNRIWTARFFTTLAMRLLKQRPGEIDQSKAICLSFYVNRDALDLGAYRIASDDVAFAFWALQMYPVYGNAALFTHYQKENAYWLDEMFHHVVWTAQHPKRHISITRIERVAQRFFTRCAPEQWLKRWQKKHLPQKIATRANEDTCVVVSDDVLKLHTHDNRAEYLTQWKHTLATYLTKQ